MPLTKQRDNLWVLTFVAPVDQHVYTISYPSLASAAANAQADHDAVIVLTQTAAVIRAAHAKLAQANSTIYEFSTNVNAQQKQIVVSLATQVPGGQGADQYTRTLQVVTGVGGLAQVFTTHAQNHAAHLALIASNVAALAKLQAIGTAPPTL
jgi:hypothetical protein